MAFGLVSKKKKSGLCRFGLKMPVNKNKQRFAIVFIRFSLKIKRDMSQSVHLGETTTVSVRMPVADANVLYDEAHEMGVPVSRLLQYRIAGNSRNLNPAKPKALQGVPSVEFRPNAAGKAVLSAGGGASVGLVSYHGLRSAGVDQETSRDVGVVAGLVTFALIFSQL